MKGLPFNAEMALAVWEVVEGETEVKTEAGEAPEQDRTTMKAKKGYDKGAAVLCPNLEEGQQLTNKVTCNECAYLVGCPAWE